MYLLLDLCSQGTLWDKLGKACTHIKQAIQCISGVPPDMHAQITAEHMTIGANQFLLVRSKGETNSAVHVGYCVYRTRKICAANFKQSTIRLFRANIMSCTNQNVAKTVHCAGENGQKSCTVLTEFGNMAKKAKKRIRFLRHFASLAVCIACKLFTQVVHCHMRPVADPDQVFRGQSYNGAPKKDLTCSNIPGFLWQSLGVTQYCLLFVGQEIGSYCWPN